MFFDDADDVRWDVFVPQVGFALGVLLLGLLLLLLLLRLLLLLFFFRAINDPPDPRVPLGDPRDPGDMF